MDRLVWLTAAGKTRTMRQYAISGATDPTIRLVSVRLVQSARRGDDVERLRRLHAWVRSAVDYHREPIEMFHPAGHVARYGGDCDDLVILLGALAWSLKYPFRIEPIGNPDGPRHYSIRLGYPESETPDGTADTRWLWAEASVQARFGESPFSAELRRAHL